MRTIIVTSLFNLNNSSERYLKQCEVLIENYLKFTDFHILILTNIPNSLNYRKNERVIIVNYDDFFNDSISSNGKFNMHLKRLPIRLGMELNFDIVYHHDCDVFITGWENKSYEELIKKDYDVYFPNSSRPQLGGLRKNFPHFQKKIDLEFEGLYRPEFDNAPNASETLIIFKNNDKLKKFIEFWDMIAKQNKNYLTYHCSIYFGTSSIYANMNMTDVTPDSEFTKFVRIHHNGKFLNYHGRHIN